MSADAKPENVFDRVVGPVVDCLREIGELSELDAPDQVMSRTVELYQSMYVVGVIAEELIEAVLGEALSPEDRARVVQNLRDTTLPVIKTLREMIASGGVGDVPVPPVRAVAP